MKMSRQRGNIILAVLCLFIVIILLSAWSLTSLTPKGVAVLEIKGREITLEASGYGNVEENSRNGLYMNLPAKISEVFVKVGQRVKKGDVLATVDLDATEVALSLSAAGLVKNGEYSKDYYSASGLSSLSNLNSNQLADQLDKIPEKIVAKYDALVEEVNVKEQSFTNPYNPLFILSDISRILVVVSVDEAAAVSVKVGQHATVSGNGLTKKYDAEVISVASSATQEVSLTLTQSKLNVTLRVLNPDKNLKLGLTAKATIALNQLDQAIIIPYESVFQQDELDCVYILSKGRVKKRIVEIGESFDSGVLIVSGLEIGDILVLDPETVSREGMLARGELS